MTKGIKNNQSAQSNIKKRIYCTVCRGLTTATTAKSKQTQERLPILITNVKAKNGTYTCA